MARSYKKKRNVIHNTDNYTNLMKQIFEGKRKALFFNCEFFHQNVTEIFIIIFSQDVNGSEDN